MDDEARLRRPPRERFRGAERRFDLDKAFAALPEESVPRHGRMQKTLYRHGAMTTAIFALEQGAALEPYAVDGESVVHVVRGRIRVGAEADTYELGQGQLLLLDPGVAHRIEALEPSRLLLTVVLAEDGPSGATGRIPGGSQ